MASAGAGGAAGTRAGQSRRPSCAGGGRPGLGRLRERPGVRRAAHEGAQCYAARVAAARPELAETIRDLAARYSALRYGTPQDEQMQQEFIKLIAKFRQG